MKNRVLIIGGSGFIGSKVAHNLIRSNYSVTVFDKKKSLFDKKVRFLQGDVLNIKSLEKAVKGHDIIYNFAALADIDEARYKPSETIKINILAVSNILQISLKYKIKRFIQASSIYAMSNEGGFYACSKRASEDYIQEFNKMYKIDYTILRFGSLYGPNADQTNGIKKMILSAKKQKKIVYRGNRSATRRYIHVEDAAILCKEILKLKFKNKIINITGKKILKIKDVIRNLVNIFNLNRKKVFFKNEKNSGHYTNQPTEYNFKKSKNLFIKNERNFLKVLNELSNEQK